jgi:hypothetical protein
MRLTLRSMLAYMDRLLESDDAEDIRKKIDDSPFATNLYHRLRDVMQRLRLTAPSLTERVGGMDPNTVAEYLDNALPSDRVPDFETACLESDIHLAEVGSCHQILALVLGEPAEIDPASRQRMYQLLQVAAQAEQERLSTVARAAVLGDGSDKARPKPTVPEYLREPVKRRRLLPIAAALLLAGGLVGMLLSATGQLDQGSWLWNRFHPGQAGVEVTKAPEPVNEPSPAPSTKPETKQPSGTPSDTKKTPETAPADGTKSAPEKPPAKAVVENAPTEPEVAKKPEEKAPAAEVKPPAPKPAATEEANLPPLPTNPAVPSEKPAGPQLKVASLPPRPDSAKPDVKPEAVQRAGRFISDLREVLLKFDPAAANWRRVAPEEFLPAGQALIALPTYRPRVVILNVGATLELLGGTRAELLAEEPQARVGVDVAYGRLVIKPFAQPGIRLRLMVGKNSGTITLSSVDTIAALEVVRTHEAAADPETEPSHVAATLYVAHGAATWEDGEKGKPVQLSEPARLALQSGPAESPAAMGLKDMPKWILAESISPLDQRASAVLAQSIQPNRSVGLALMELTEHRQKEVKWLAARCLGYLGQFDPIVAALNDPQFSREWPDYVEQLRQAMALNAESAAAIHQAMEKRFGAEATALYRMLWGYTDQGLKEKGEDKQLVDLLDHQTLAFRVLAFWNLKDITGASLFYRPEYPPAKRQQPVARWHERQLAGQIRVKTPEEKPGGSESGPLPSDDKPSPLAKPPASKRPGGEKAAPARRPPPVVAPEPE